MGFYYKEIYTRSGDYMGRQMLCDIHHTPLDDFSCPACVRKRAEEIERIEAARRSAEWERQQEIEAAKTPEQREREKKEREERLRIYEEKKKEEERQKKEQEKIEAEKRQEEWRKQNEKRLAKIAKEKEEFNRIVFRLEELVVELETSTYKETYREYFDLYEKLKWMECNNAYEVARKYDRIWSRKREEEEKEAARLKKEQEEEAERQEKQRKYNELILKRQKAQSESEFHSLIHEFRILKYEESDFYANICEITWHTKKHDRLVKEKDQLAKEKNKKAKIKKYSELTEEFKKLGFDEQAKECEALGRVLANKVKKQKNAKNLIAFLVVIFLGVFVFYMINYKPCADTIKQNLSGAVFIHVNEEYIEAKSSTLINFFGNDVEIYSIIFTDDLIYFSSINRLKEENIISYNYDLSVSLFGKVTVSYDDSKTITFNVFNNGIPAKFLHEEMYFTQVSD